MTGHGGDVTSLNKGVFRLLKNRCLKKASHVTVVSKLSKKIVKELMPNVNVDIISMGVNTEKFNRRYCVPNYFGQRDKKVVLFVGRLVEIKGVKYLIEAMKQVDALLVIVGDGPLRQSLESQAKELNGRVKFLGTKSHIELPSVYASADLLVVPSVTIGIREQEGVPTTIMEAMASGLPVIASDSGGISDIIFYNETGVIVEEKNVNQIANSIGLLLNDKDLYNRIADNIEVIISRYDYAVIGKKYAEILNRSIEKVR